MPGNAGTNLGRAAGRDLFLFVHGLGCGAEGSTTGLDCRVEGPSPSVPSEDCFAPALVLSRSYALRRIRKRFDPDYGAF